MSRESWQIANMALLNCTEWVMKASDKVQLRFKEELWLLFYLKQQQGGRGSVGAMATVCLRGEEGWAYGGWIQSHLDDQDTDGLCAELEPIWNHMASLGRAEEAYVNSGVLRESQW